VILGDYNDSIKLNSVSAVLSSLGNVVIKLPRLELKTKLEMVAV
jgi:hypothetical protein